MTSSDLRLLFDEPTNLRLSTSEESTIRAEGYAITDKLGEGSYAKVYLAEYCAPGHILKVKLACKVYDREKVPRDIDSKFLPRELNILMRLEPSHPHIVHVHSIFQRRSKVFIFMGYVENGELLTHVQKHGPVNEAQARVWFRQLVLAVQYLHALHIVHRDVTCQNILISANQNIKLADFGFARLARDDRGHQVMSETYCGSPAYTAPEVLRGKPYEPKMADVWSCGIVLYVMINKAMPFDDRNIPRLLKNQTNKKWKHRNSVRSTLSAQLKSLVSQVMEPNTKKRVTLEEILSCDWIAMSPALMRMTDVESSVLQAAASLGHHSTPVPLLDPTAGPVQHSSGQRKSRGSFCSVVNVFSTESTSPHAVVNVFSTDSTSPHAVVNVFSTDSTSPHAVMEEAADWPAQVVSLRSIRDAATKETTKNDRKRAPSLNYLTMAKRALRLDKKKKRRVSEVETLNAATIAGRSEKEHSDNTSSDVDVPVKHGSDTHHVTVTDHLEKRRSIVSDDNVTSNLSVLSNVEASDGVDVIDARSKQERGKRRVPDDQVSKAAKKLKLTVGSQQEKNVDVWREDETEEEGGESERLASTATGDLTAGTRDAGNTLNAMTDNNNEGST